MQDKELHKLLNEKLQDFEMPVAPDSWDALEKRLPVPAERRVIPLWIKWTAAAACVLIAALVATPFISKHNAESDNLTAQVETAVNTPKTVMPETVSETMPTEEASEQTAVETTLNASFPKARKTPQVVSKPVKENKMQNPSEALLHPVLVAQNEGQNTTISSEKSVTHNDEVPTLTEEEAAELLQQADNKMRQQLLAQETEQQTDKRRHNNREAVNKSNNPTLGLLASMNANDYLGSSNVNRPNRVDAVNPNNGEDGPIKLPPQTNEEMRNDLPFSMGLSVGIPLANRWDLFTGINYTYMHSQRNVSIVTGESSVSDYDLHYLGVPVQVSYRIIDRSVIKFYVSAGGAMEKGLVRTEHKTFVSEDAVITSQKMHSKVPGLQWSVGGNIGLSLRLYKGLEFYVEPGLQYYIPNTINPQPESMRTENPFFFSLGGGLRFSLK